MLIGKVIHIFALLGWFTGIFAVPRALIYVQKAATSGKDSDAVEQIKQLTFRLYRFAGFIGLFAGASGLYLAHTWQYDTWVWAKLGIGGLLVAHYVYTGILVINVVKHDKQYSELFLRIWNESSVLLAIALVYLGVYKSASAFL